MLSNNYNDVMLEGIEYLYNKKPFENVNKIFMPGNI